MSKQWILLALSTFMLSLSHAQTMQFGPQHTPQNEVLDEIALIINDEVLTRRQLNAELAGVRQQVGNIGDVDAQMLDNQLLERVIMDHLIRQLANRAGTEINASDIDQAVAQVAAQNNVDAATLLARVKRDTGLNENQFRAQLAQDIATQQLRVGLVGGEIRVSESQINDQIAQIARAQGSTMHVQDLLVPVPSGGVSERGEEVEALIATVSTTIVETGDLSDAAKRIPGARFNDLGVINLAQIPPRFAQVISNLPSGEVASTPVVDSDGMHFLKVLSKNNGDGGYQVPEAKVAHILLRVNGEGEAVSQQARIEQIYRQVQQGGNFADLASQYSDDTASAIRGGELGWTSADSVVPEFAEQMLQAPLNTITPPFRTAFGWHIIRVEDRRVVDRSEDVLREQIRQNLMEKYIEDAWQQRLLEIRQEAYIDIR